MDEGFINWHEPLVWNTPCSSARFNGHSRELHYGVGKSSSLKECISYIRLFKN